jgi:uncharacterized pyridoxamine 5'-phosphate oxidase family protein
VRAKGLLLRYESKSYFMAENSKDDMKKLSHNSVDDNHNMLAVFA